MNDIMIYEEEPPRVGTRVLFQSHPSRLDLKEGIVATYVAAVTAPGWVKEEEAYWMQLCLEEVVVNAMLHGNEGDPRLAITLDLRDHGEDWVLIVEDRGEGFTLEDLPDLDDPENLILEHGRGVALMLGWLSQLTYYRHGACAWLRRKKDSLSEGTAP